MVPIITSSDQLGPKVFGLFKAKLVLPHNAISGCSRDSLEHIIAHELAHIRRGDNLVALAQLATQIVWWFHPLVWWANRCICRERERCCDDAAIVGLECDPGGYAQTLLDVLRWKHQTKSAWLGSAIRQSDVTRERLESIMDHQRTRYCRTPRSYWAMFSASILLLVPSNVLSVTPPSRSNQPPVAFPAQRTAEPRERFLGATDLAAKAPLDVGLVGYYSFDGNVQDQTGNKNHGKPHGVVEYVEGVFGQAVRFHGYDNRGYVRIRNSKTLEFDKAMTFACWYRIDGEAGQTSSGVSGARVARANQAIVAKAGDRPGFTIMSFAENRTSRDIAIWAHLFTQKQLLLFYPPAVPLGRWHHVATVADESGVRLYHDGNLVGATTARLDMPKINDQDIFVGIQGPSGSSREPEGFRWYPLNGAIDDLRIYRRALSASEIRGLIEASKARSWGPEQATGPPDTPNGNHRYVTA